MIEASCYTNLDNFQKFNWPSVFASTPNKGDYVESVCGKRMLKVASIMHTTRKTHYTSVMNVQREPEPIIVVELHK